MKDKEVRRELGARNWRGIIMGFDTLDNINSSITRLATKLEKLEAYLGVNYQQSCTESLPKYVKIKGGK